jgi:argininosuccinate lyase
MSSFDLRANLRNVADRAQEEVSRTPAPAEAGETSLWRALMLVNVAHAQQLARSGVIDETGFQAITRALDATMQATPGSQVPSALLREAEARVDAMLPSEFAGAATLGASRTETIATALRMSWRERLLGIQEGITAFREALISLADAHAVTIMAASWDRRPANPTTLAHFLGGVIGPLGIVSQRLRLALDLLDRSPFGAGVLVGDVLEADREELARSLGFTGPIQNTLDALGSIEDLVSVAEATAATVASSRRLFTEILTWIRTDPSSFFLDERWEDFPEPSMPALAISSRLEKLVLQLQGAQFAARGFVDLVRSLPYGPLGASWDAVAISMDEVMSSADAGVRESTAAINEALIVNRAYLANRAGRLYTTASDLVPFLMTEESLAPTAARHISSLVVSRLREAHLEASAVTQDMIDSAALMVIGRELKVEMETLGRYLAPRRFIERRVVTGSAAPAMTREWLQSERDAVTADISWAKSRRQRWTAAEDALIAVLASSTEGDEG